MELINGELWANVWMTDCIARISLESGKVTHWMLLHGLKEGLHKSHPQHRHSMDVLNGGCACRAALLRAAFGAHGTAPHAPLLLPGACNAQWMPLMQLPRLPHTQALPMTVLGRGCS